MSASATNDNNNDASPIKRHVLLIGTALPPILEQLQARFHVHILDDHDGEDEREAWLQQHGATMDYVMTNNGRGVPQSYWPWLSHLKLVASFGVGYDSIDCHEAVTRHIVVTHTPGVLDAETSTTAVLLYLACFRDLLACDKYARSGTTWQDQGPHPLTRTADGRHVGILGLGRIGQAIANKLQHGFDCRISYHSRNPKTDAPADYTYYDSLENLARDVDCLICICPGGAATKHMVNEAVLNALGSDGILINVARGSVVDETALIAALQQGRLARAGLDVFEHEPFVPPALQALSNTVLLPHMGSATIETRLAMGQLTLDNLVQYDQDGTVLTPVPECASYAKIAAQTE